MFLLKSSTSYDDLRSLKKPLAATDALGSKTWAFKSCKQTFWSSQFTTGMAVSVQTTISQRFCMQSITESNDVFLRWENGSWKKSTGMLIVKKPDLFSLSLPKWCIFLSLFLFLPPFPFLSLNWNHLEAAHSHSSEPLISGQISCNFCCTETPLIWLITGL